MFPTKTARVAILFTLLCAPCATAADLEFSLSNSPPAGTLVAHVFDNANSFSDFRDPVHVEQFQAEQGNGRYRIENLPSGDYALLVFHDQNSNGILDRNFAGIPKEPIAVSNNYRPKKAPNYSRASITLNEGQTLTQELSLAPPLGNFGQIGVGLGAVVQSSPYKGSDSARVLAIPTVVYIGKRLQVMGPGASYTLLGSDWVRLSVRGRLRIGAYEEDDSPMLTGMGDRKTTFMGGLALATDLPGGINLSLSYSHDLLDRVGGGTASASLSKGFQLGSWRLIPALSANWLDEDLANYDFGVPMANARADRPAYRLNDAVNWGLGFTTLYEITPRWHAVLSVGRDQLDSDISASPLIDEEHLVRGFMALSYTF